MRNNPLVSVIIATYNRAEYIKKAINSALEQTYKNIEIIIVDDGSKDSTKEVINPYIKEKKIKYIYQNNAGSLKARDNGIRAAGGNYIAVLDSDDYWCDNRKLEKQIIFLENSPSYVLAGGGMILIDENNKEADKYLFPEKDKDIRKSILVKNVFVHSSVVFKKESWQKVNGYCGREKPFVHDWSFWLELGKLGKFYNFQEYFVKYIKGTQNSGGRNIFNCTNLQRLKINIEIRKKYRKDYPNFYKAFVLAWMHYFYSIIFKRRKKLC